jgi:tetratricopeptide (TPR) repeat protein
MGTRISLCMIVKNEAAALPRTLAAVRPWIDELVVVDTGSTDGTREIAREHGARVHEWAWRDDFAAARNESLRHATGDWILVLDADEVLAEGCGPVLRAACETAPPDVAGFEIKIVCPREGDAGLVRLNWFPRLFRNVPGARFEGVIHEQVVGSLVGHGRIEKADVEVLHSGYTLSPEQMQAKALRNVALLERQLHDEPDYAPGWFQIAETYVLLGRLDEAIEAYRRCLRVLDLGRLTLPAGVVAVALQNLGAALFARNARGDREEGRKSVQAALSICPDLAPSYVHLGNVALVDGEWEAAERNFAEAIAAAERGGDGGEYQISPWLIHFLHGCARARQDKHDEALDAFDRALALNPRHLESLWLLALTAGHASQWARGLAALDGLAALGRDDFAIHAQRAQTLAALERHADAAEAAHRALAFEPASAPVLALAAESLARAGRPGEAASMYERLAALSPQLPGPLLALAQCREQAGDPAGMMEAYGAAVALAPQAPEVLFALGSACLRGGALDTAEECLAGAVAATPERPDYRLNLALCRIKRGAVAQARQDLDEILARWPRTPHAAELRALAERLCRLSEVAAG